MQNQSKTQGSLVNNSSYTPQKTKQLFSQKNAHQWTLLLDEISSQYATTIPFGKLNKKGRKQLWKELAMIDDHLIEQEQLIIARKQNASKLQEFLTALF